MNDELNLEPEHGPEMCNIVFVSLLIVIAGLFLVCLGLFALVFV